MSYEFYHLFPMSYMMAFDIHKFILYRLAQGNKYGVTSTDTIDFIHYHEVPPDRKVIYGSMVFDQKNLSNLNQTDVKLWQVATN